MVHVIVPQGGGQYSQLTPFSLTVIWPARCVTITPAGNVGEKERQRDRKTEREKRGLKGNSQGHIKSTAGANTFLFKRRSYSKHSKKN